ncbi:N-acetyltransferase family protein [Tundrisphaera sp. TA3]|uniref:GNAT family N-acetyltransferase n=1 Tax=Tundrisphaera sp. TA3 TaxID=3435775 RepID=UPI003EBBB3D7
MVTIRTAGLGDAAALADLARRTFHDTFAAQNRPEDMKAYMSGAYTAGRLDRELREPGAVYLMAEDATKLIGFAKVAPSEPPPCVTVRDPLRLARLYVAAEALGSGVGAALMRECIGRAEGSGHGGLWLGVWEHNRRAIAFYERWGFAPVGTEPFLLGSDRQTDVLMQLDLGNRAG